MLFDFSYVRFRPWVGDTYESGIQGKKILILGESHHHRCSRPGDPCSRLTPSQRTARHQNLTCEVVEWWSKRRVKTPVARIVPALFGFDRYDFWQHVGFYNYVQSFVLAPRVRPTDMEFENSASAFQEVLDGLRPDRVLVLGKKCWLSLPGSEGPLHSPPVPEPGVGAAEDLGLTGSSDHYAC